MAKSVSGGRRVSYISATEAAKTFGRLVDRVREERATYIVERSGTPVARVSPVDRAVFTMRDLKVLLARRSASAEYLDAVDTVLARRRQPRVRRNPWGR